MKLWGGRFAKEESSLASEFNASIKFDKRMYSQDIKGSIVHSAMLAKQGIISQNDADTIKKELLNILDEIEKGEIEFSIENEDIHMNIESILTSRIGEAGKRLHTARSRNDQVALDLRLYLKEEIINIIELQKNMNSIILKLAKENQETIMPGYTHMQKAQPVTLAFHLLAYYQMFKRDISRMEDCLERMDYLPLGSGALAGTTYNTDRQYIAKELGFAHVCPNAMDGVSDRDYCIEFLSNASISMMHLSRFCEEIILWSTAEFNFIEIDDAYSTGSSIMPQKKNPDMAELIRGKTGAIYGDLFALLTLMKSLPLAYNKDMQEDKPPVFDAVDNLKACISIFSEMINTIKINNHAMLNSAKTNFTNATDAADYLVSKGIAFRDCHAIIGKLVLYCINNDTTIESLPLSTLQEFSSSFDTDVYEHINIEACVNAKISEGGTSFDNVKKQIENEEDLLNKLI